MRNLKLETKSVAPRQLMMIAALAVTLIGAVYWPNGDTEAVDPGENLPGPPSAPGARVRRSSAAVIKPKEWPAADLAAALQYDPFSSPLFAIQQMASNEVEAEPTDEHADLLALQQDGVSMIVRDEAGMVANVGDRKLRVGDTIDGYRVVAIEMDGVVLERVQSK